MRAGGCIATKSVVKYTQKMTRIKKHQEIDCASRLIADWRSMAIVHAVYEDGVVRYTELAEQLGFSPTVLSQKLTRLTELGILQRTKKSGEKLVQYSPALIAKDIVNAYHILETVNGKLKQQSKKIRSVDE